MPQEPNPEDPLNKEAAEVLQTNRRLFEQNVAKSMRGGHIGNVYFERCLKWSLFIYNGFICVENILLIHGFVEVFFFFFD